MDLSRRALLSFGYAWSGNGQPRPVWVDQDGGWEDVAALAILLRSPDVKVEGIATTPGIADAATARARVSQLLEALREREAKLIDEIPAAAEILATGPLTRVGRLIEAGKAPRRVTWMGGAVHVKGNAKGNAEWNAAADPKALQTVLSARIDLTLCPLDLTNQFPSDASLIASTGTAWVERIREAYAEKERYWWDELAAASLAAPALFQRQTLRLVADRNGRLSPSARGTPAQVLTQCDAAGFRNLLAASLRV